ncbi:MAG: histidinol-phosphate transaminase [Actinomycetota bacterium]
MKRPDPRPDLDKLQPYYSSETAGGRIFLHANENPYPPPDDVLNEIFEAAAKIELNRYPDPEPIELIEELASYAGVDRSWIWIGDGSNEVLLQACLAYGGPGRTALMFEPTYVMHQRQARMSGMDVEVVAREADFSIDVDRATSAIKEKSPAIVFVCTPNNPTGTVTPVADVHRIAEAASGALVIVDEAYFEFCGLTVAGDLPDFPNVLVARTLSKAFRLASVRLGYGIGDPVLLEQMRRVRMPYAQSAFTQLAATVAVRRRAEMLPIVDQIVAERDRLIETLAKVARVEVFGSGANFVLFRYPEAARLLDELAGRGIVIRDFSHLKGCENCLRVTAGTPAENDSFLEVVTTLV